jgi:predicted enzyme related to lactoylglutathione lyase
MKMKANPVSWFEIYVKDMPRAKAFYEGTLGTRLQRLETTAAGVTEMWAFSMSNDTYGATGALVRMDAGRPEAVAAPSSISSATIARLKAAAFQPMAARS